jgi:peptidoglycan/LPS O-acetylase OafA/YrhL
VIIVVLSHAGVPGFGGGKTGVLLFFVLSGYLITSILLRELDRTGRVRFGRFYIRRALRLYPALITATVVTALVSIAFLIRGNNSSTASASLEAIPSVVLYFNNWVPIFSPDTKMGYFSHFWSLAVEEQFYLVWPIFLLLLYRWKKLPGVLTAALIGAGMSLVFKIVIWDGGASRQGGTDFASDGLLLGCALAALLAMRPLPAWIGRAAFWPALAGLAAAVVLGDSGTGDPAAYEIFGRVFWPIAVVAATLLVLGLVTSTTPVWAQRLLESRVMVYLGRISYGIYLWHILVMNAVWFLTDSPLIVAPITLAGAIGIAALSFRFVELPFLRQKRKYESDAEAAQTDSAQYGLPSSPSSSGPDDDVDRLRQR